MQLVAIFLSIRNNQLHYSLFVVGWVISVFHGVIKNVSDKRDLLEENLFGDLELPEQKGFSQSELPAFEEPSKPVPKKHFRPKTTTHALKQPPRRDLTGLWIGLGIFLLVAGGAVGVLFFMEIGPFAKPVAHAVVTPTKRVVKKKHKKLMIQINTEPVGASIEVNGQKLAFQTPYQLHVLLGRKYHLVLRKKGFVDTKQTVDATATKEKIVILNLKLQGGAPKLPLIKGTPGVLFLECAPVGAKINIGGFDRGLCRDKPVRIELQGGKEQIVKVLKEGHDVYEETMNIPIGEVKMKKVVLNEKSSSKKKNAKRRKHRTKRKAKGKHRKRRRIRGFGKAMISCSPKADVYWKGRKIGRTPLSFKFPAGRQKIVLKNSRLGALKGVSLFVKPRKITKQTFAFRKGTLKFIIRPWADVYIKGRKIGQTPIRPHRVYEGFYRVELRMNKKKKVMRVRVKGGQTTPVIHIFN